MAIRYTSHEALASIADELSGRRQEVYEVIRDWHPATDGEGPSIEDIAIKLRRQQSSVSGRCTELKELGLILEGPFKVNRSGKRALTYIAVAYAPFRVEFDKHEDGQLDFAKAIQDV